jgi:hypothetical protein
VYRAAVLRNLLFFMEKVVRSGLFVAALRKKTKNNQQKKARRSEPFLT